MAFEAFKLIWGFLELKSGFKGLGIGFPGIFLENCLKWLKGLGGGQILDPLSASSAGV